MILDSSVACIPELLSITKIGSWNVRCRLPLICTCSVGVIGPLGEDISDAELASELTRSGYPDTSAERILRGKDKIKTSMFKINFPLGVLPSYVYLGYQRFRVNTFVSKPWQCFRCQDFGHNAKDCRGPPRCVGCSGPHNVKDCPASGGSSPKCCNCGGPHTASYGGCPRMKFESHVEKTRTEKRISYRDALKVVKRSQPEKSAVTHQEQTFQPPQYSWVAQQPTHGYSSQNHNRFTKSQNTMAKSVATQTCGSNESSSDMGSVSVTKLVELLSRVLCLCGNTANINIVETVAKIAEDIFKAPEQSTISTDNAQLPVKPSPKPHAASLHEPGPIETEPVMMETEIEPSPIIGGQYLLNKTKHSSKAQPPPTLGGKITKQPTLNLDSISSLKITSLASSLDANTQNMKPSPIIGGQSVRGKHKAVKKPEPTPHEGKTDLNSNKDGSGTHKGSAVQDENPKCLPKRK